MINEIREEPGKKYALTFTIMVHVALVAALFLGVQWKRSKPEVMEVELWSATPQPAQVVPPPPPPEPEVKPEPKPIPKVEPKPEPPKKPDIAIKEEKKPPKPEPKKPEPPEPKKPEPKPEVKPPPKDAFKEMLEREEKQRINANNQAKFKAEAEAEQREQRASANKRGLADYAAKIRGKVRGNIVLPPSIQGNPEAVFAVSQLPSGEVLDIKLKRSSGNPALDTAIERAILKSSPLPKPDDPALFQRTLEIKYKPFEE